MLRNLKWYFYDFRVWHIFYQKFSDMRCLGGSDALCGGFVRRDVGNAAMTAKMTAILATGRELVEGVMGVSCTGRPGKSQGLNKFRNKSLTKHDVFNACLEKCMKSA